MIDGGEKIRSSFYPEVVLELALVKMSTVGKVEKIDDMLKRLEKLSPQKSGGEKTPGSTGGQKKAAAHTPEKQEDKPAEKDRDQIKQKDGGGDGKRKKETSEPPAEAKTAGSGPESRKSLTL